MMPSHHELFEYWRLRPDPSALAALLEATQERIYRICFQVLRHRQDAEEAKQEVLLEITSGINSVADAAHFERWVGKVAFRTALDKRRMRLRRSAHENHAAGRAPNGNGPDDALHEGMSRLDEEDRVLLIERYFDRRTLQEVGDRRGISAVAARKRIEKARVRLKRMLGGAVALFPGDPFSESLLGKAASTGVIAMKLKTLANAATILILLSIVCGGAWIFLRPPLPNAGTSSASLPTRGSEIRRSHFVNAPPAGIPTPGRTSGPPAVTKGENYPPGHWSRMLQLIDQIALMSRRIPVLKAESRESLSEEEGRSLQREAKLLEESIQGLYKELAELAPQDPAAVVAFVKTGRGHVLRQTLMTMIRDAVEAEIEGERSPSGPLLSGLLALATGDATDKRTILQFARSLGRANRAIGEAALPLMADGNDQVRWEAAAVLSDHAKRGNLRTYLLENAAALRQAATTNTGPMDYLTRGFALTAVAALNTPENDDFVLQRLEALNETRDAYQTLEAMLHVAPRVPERHQARIHATLLRILETPFYHHCDAGVRELALFLPRESCLAVLRIAAAKPQGGPADAPNMAEWLLKEVEAGRQETLRSAFEKQRRDQFTGKVLTVLVERR